MAHPGGLSGPSGLTPAELFDLTGRTAIVTGASAGLGEQLARTLVAAGARVAVAARRADRLETLAAELPELVAVPCDIAVEADRVRLVDTVTSELGPVDILVNNAGIVGKVAPAQHVDVADVQHTIDVNLLAPLRLSTLVLPGMRERGGGSIVNISSISGMVGIAGQLPQAAYVASKTGLVGLTRELALQWARYRVRVNAIAAGYFESEMTADMYAVPEMAAWVDQNTPIGRRGRPADFAGTLLLLASDAGSYLTGSTVVVDGGWTAR